MTPDKDEFFWNALKKSRRVRSPVLGCVLALSGGCAGVGVGWWLLPDSPAAGGPAGAQTSPWLSGEAAALCYGALAALPFLLLARRFFAREARAALRARDGSIRPFVLYLRAFHADAGWHGWFTEPRLGRVLRRVGVPVCVGRPGERLPPHGFHRIYFADGDWQQGVLTMAARARLVVALVGKTGGLAWEIRQLRGRRWLAKTVLLLPARDHEQHRRQLLAQHGIAVPELRAHYAPAFTWRRLDLCPVQFPDPIPVGEAVAVVPGKMVLPGPLRVLYLLFCLAVLLLSFVVPRLRRFDWLADERSIHVNYGHTLEPALKRLDPAYSARYWDRLM
jgi:hypothetical protein